MTTHAASRTDVIAPAGGGRETLWIFSVVVAIVVGMGMFAQFNAQREERFRFADWQISAFDDLGPTDQAIYNALYSAAETLWANYEFDRQWTAVVDLDIPEYGVAPFVRDVSWKQTGEVQWQLIKSFSFEGGTAYFGNRGKVPGQGAYLLILTHSHKGASYADQSVVWLNPDPNIAAPETIVRDSLIRNGWREIVPYSGDTEMRRLGRRQ